MINLNDIPYRHTAFLLHPPSPLIGEMGGLANSSPTGVSDEFVSCLVLCPNSSPPVVSDEFGWLLLCPNWLFSSLSKLVSDGSEFG